MSGAFSFTTDPYRRENGSKKHNPKTSHHVIGTESFVGIDGEGVTLPSGEHRYVLLGIGQDQIEDPKGLHWSEIFDFLYSKYKPRTAYTGFYLGYDFTQWLKSLPQERAWKLLTIDGKESRRSTSPKLRGRFLPVDLDGWQVDILGQKQLSIRRKECKCETMKCPHPKGPWLYVCDAGPFFQTSFLNVIDPANWAEPIVSGEEYETIKAGKELRATAELDEDMRYYNRLENEVMGRVMRDLNAGFVKLDVNLSPKQWYGPGQASQSWLSGRAPSTKDVNERVPEWFLDAARQSYFGGWFEIQAHGIVPGVSHEYDINSAYPHIIASLPCLMHGTYSSGQGKPPPATGEGEICLVRALVWKRPPHSDPKRGQVLGAMLHRDRQGRISRPLVTAGWYWLDELEAACKAGAVSRIPRDRYYEWVKYVPCDCKPPIWQIRNLYQMRLDVGKKTSLGKSAKLVASSSYGKVAQSVGYPRYANPVYASRITSGCRRIILDAIATHPRGLPALLMVATDAVFFTDPHPGLPVSKTLGEWDYEPRDRLTLFKPGVYWDDQARAVIAEGRHPSFKARGVSARDFAACIAEIDEAFASWGGAPPLIPDRLFDSAEIAAFGGGSWPRVTFRSSFSMVTALQALMRNDWAAAGTLDFGEDGLGKELVQSANPSDKRRALWYDENGGRPLYRSEPLEAGANARWRHWGNVALWGEIEDEDFSSVPYEKRFGLEDPFSDEVQQARGVSPDEAQPMRGAFRVLTRQE